MVLRRFLLAGVMAALAFPLAALAQTAPAPPFGGPSPEMRAQFEKIRAQYQTAVLNDLSADHRAKVQAIFAQVQSGSLDRRDAATQIDGILTPSESQAVLAEGQKMRDDMHKAMAANAQGQHRMNRKPDAGRILMMLSMPPGAPQNP